ncbi:MAG: hypothetical protein PHN49_00300 [Candidatus Omnitrophica bacterium]|nr:hypothetical protein [Candidatus Omnitrophota bacterium]
MIDVINKLKSIFNSFNSRVREALIRTLKNVIAGGKTFLGIVRGWVWKKTESITMSSIKSSHWLYYFFKRTTIPSILSILVSLAGVAGAVFLWQPSSLHFLAQIQNVDSIFLGIGGLIGTILALVLTLSIIPIQHAADNLTQSIIHLYREDRATRCVFAILSISCVASFFFVFLRQMGESQPMLLIVQFLILAFSLDLTRFYHRHIVNLLAVDRGINKLRDKIRQQINAIQGRIAFLSSVRFFFFSKEQKKSITKGKLEAALYGTSQLSNGPIALISELAEIALKAVSRNEIHRANLAINALSDVACHYATVRRDNLILFPEPGSFDVRGSDIGPVLTAVYENYKDISNSAVGMRNEVIPLHSIKALARIAIHLTNLKAGSFEENSAPLTFMPIGYIETCIDAAQRQRLDDVPFQGANHLLDIAKNVPPDVDIADVYFPVLNVLNKISLAFLLGNKSALLNGCIEKMMIIAHHAVANKHFCMKEVIQNVLEKLQEFFPYTISYEKLYGAKFLGEPLTPAYDLTNVYSTGYLVARLKDSLEVDAEKPWANPFNDFIDVNKVIWRHFYALGEKIEFGDSFMLWHVLQTIKHISKIFIELLANPISKNEPFLSELSQCFQWYCSFFWLAFNKKVSINFRHAEEATGICAYIGLHFFKLGREDVVKMCIDNIASISESYRQISNSGGQYNNFNMADLLMPLWYFRLVGEKHGNADMIKLVDAKLVKYDVLKSGTPEYDAFENRKGHLEKELDERMHISEIDKAIGVLRKLLGINSQLE